MNLEIIANTAPIEKMKCNENDQQDNMYEE